MLLSSFLVFYNLYSSDNGQSFELSEKIIRPLLDGARDVNIKHLPWLWLNSPELKTFNLEKCANMLTYCTD